MPQLFRRASAFRTAVALVPLLAMAPTAPAVQSAPAAAPSVSATAAGPAAQPSDGHLRTPSVNAVEERVYVETAVDTDHDGRSDRVAIDISRPSGATEVPVVFEHSPYSGGLNSYPNHGVNLDRLPQEGLFGAAGGGSSAGPDTPGTRSAPDLPGWYDDYFLPRGYAVVLGHSIGTGDSEGCPTSGDMNETLGTTAVIDWLNGRSRGFDSGGRAVTASWSSGNVGMIGISYNGTLPNMAASTGVEGLKAIVPIAAISSWYDYYRANGLVVAPGGYQGEDADVLARSVVSRTGCEGALDAIEAAQDRVSGDMTAFWQERDYVRHADRVRAAVFVIHGQSDWNVKGSQYAQWWNALAQHDVPRKIWLHRGGHGTASRSDYRSTVGRWFDHYVKGVPNGIDTEPISEVQYADGTWRQFANWPDPAAAQTVFHLGAESAGAPGELSRTATSGELRQTFTDQGRSNRAETLAAEPDAAKGNRLVYRSPTLTSSLRLSGTPRVDLRMAITNRADANLTALLVDYGPPGSTAAPVVVTRGWLDPQNRSGSATGEKVVKGQEYALKFDMQPKDHVFAAGRRIGLVVLSTDYDYTLRPLGGTTLALAPSASSITLPLTDLGGTTPGCEGFPSKYGGTLAAGAEALQPDGKWYQSSTSGTHQGCLSGPAGTDFDLYLQKWSGSAWTTVASGTTSTPDESVSYSGSAGYYRYRVHAYRGSGGYTLGARRP